MRNTLVLATAATCLIVGAGRGQAQLPPVGADSWGTPTTQNEAAVIAQQPQAIVLPGILYIDLIKRRVTLDKGVKADYAARRFVAAIAAYLPPPCKEPK
jgi:hypothetical protein